MKYKERIGEMATMNDGNTAIIIEYKNNKDIVIKFETTGELVETEYKKFKKGAIKSHFSPSICNFGIIGLEASRDDNNKTLKSYQSWINMIKRCYDEKVQEKHPTYKDCTVCDEWKYYSNFKKWYDENYYTVNDERMEIDKDILYKGNKIYSPNTCIFVPKNINILFTKSNVNRGDLPIGVVLKGKKYQARCNIFQINSNECIRKTLGSFDNPIDAFDVYKITKENNIKILADYYKYKIPNELYNAMYEYKVSIND